MARRRRDPTAYVTTVRSCWCRRRGGGLDARNTREREDVVERVVLQHQDEDVVDLACRSHPVIAVWQPPEGRLIENVFVSTVKFRCWPASAFCSWHSFQFARPGAPLW